MDETEEELALYNSIEQFCTEDFQRLKPFLASKRMVHYIVAHNMQ
jgi:hypothetical protein